jgi:sigma-B regulation protein RsbU (phosphoserine phosphatase)
VITDPEGNIQWVNPAFSELTGYSLEELIGQNPNTLKSGEHEQSFYKNMWDTINSGQVWQGEMINKRKDGALYPEEMTITPVRDGDGKIINFVAIKQDITDRKMLEEKLKENALSAQLMYRSSELATSAETEEDALQMVLDEICKLTGWPVGHVYAVDKNGKQTLELYPTDIWSLSDPEEFAEFRRVTEITTFQQGIGLPGRVLESGKVAWISNVQEDINFIRRELTPNLVVKGAFGVPVKVFGNVEAVLEFFSDQVVESDENIINIMILVADQLSRVFERRQMEEIMREQKERMEIELNFAREIQMSMLPLIFPAFPLRKELTLHATLHPAREVGGDFYDFYFIDDDHLCFVIGDVAGKGAPGALLMAVSKTLIKSRAMDDSSPSSILTHVNNELSEENESAMFVTVFLGILNVKTGELVYTNAGHNPPYIKRGDGTLQKVDAFHGPVIGAMPELTYKQDSDTLGKDDVILLYTDGVTEALDADDRLYSDPKLVELLLEKEFKHPKDMVETVAEDVQAFQGQAEQADDITILAVQYYGLFEETGMNKLDLKIKNQIEELGVVEDEFFEFASKNQIPAADRQKVSIVLDELLNNVVTYAFQDEGEHEIEVEIELSGKRLVIIIADDGMPFNPFGREIPDTSADIDDREIGGLGIHLVRSVMDEYDYQRHIDKNVVRLVKLID